MLAEVSIILVTTDIGLRPYIWRCEQPNYYCVGKKRQVIGRTRRRDFYIDELRWALFENPFCFIFVSSVSYLSVYLCLIFGIYYRYIGRYNRERRLEGILEELRHRQHSRILWVTPEFSSHHCMINCQLSRSGSIVCWWALLNWSLKSVNEVISVSDTDFLLFVRSGEF